ncbi:MAG: hypothetical protein OXQ84_05905 [bacterium]|nr:hypothetical protein [bacterium]
MPRLLFAFLVSVAVSCGAQASGSFMFEAECQEDYVTVGEVTAGRLHCDVDIVTSDGGPFMEGNVGKLSGFVSIRQGTGDDFRLEALMELQLPGGFLYGQARRDDGVLHQGDGQLWMIGAGGDFADIEATCTYAVLQDDALRIVHDCAWRRPGR